jgi:ribonuclease E
VYEESDLVIRSIRDYFTLILPKSWRMTVKCSSGRAEFRRQVMPRYVNRIALLPETPIFSKYQLEEQIKPSLRTKST